MNIKGDNLKLLLDVLYFRRSKKEISNKLYIMIIVDLMLKLNKKINNYKNINYYKKNEIEINYDIY